MSQMDATFIASPNADYFHDPRRIAIEDRLVALREDRISVLNRGNGAVIREKDGSPSDVIRMGMDDVLRLADQHDPVRAAVVKALAEIRGGHLGAALATLEEVEA